MYLLNHPSAVQARVNKLYLHSTMYLLNRPHRLRSPAEVLAFTFHYVSIKSMWIFALLILLLIFTFHYVSIKSEKVHNDKVGLFNLHSTIYLLNLWLLRFVTRFLADLHSTMYLLNLKRDTSTTLF